MKSVIIGVLIGSLGLQSSGFAQDGTASPPASSEGAAAAGGILESIPAVGGLLLGKLGQSKLGRNVITIGGTLIGAILGAMLGMAAPTLLPANQGKPVPKWQSLAGLGLGAILGGVLAYFFSRKLARSAAEGTLELPGGSPGLLPGGIGSLVGGLSAP